MHYQRKIKTHLCDLFLTATDNHLTGVYWDKQAVPMQESPAAKKILDRTEKQLNEYLAGKRQAFDLPLQAEGTPFQQQVWRRLSAIPYGKTCSYQDIARQIKNPKACRAVGTANGRNPLSIIVPCHRVIAADGTLGGYGGGLTIKEKLLAIEMK